jgi:hypothetical protein
LGPNTSLARPNIDDEILFIFNHGSSNKFGLDCYWLFNSRPMWVKQLDGSLIDGFRVRVETPCTGFETGTQPDDHGCGGELWVCRRTNKILKEIKKARERGYPPQRIFVGGHSAGGWAALLIKRWNPGLFNGVIVTAPAFEGKRRSRLCLNPVCDLKNGDELGKAWKNRLRAQHDNYFVMAAKQGPDLRALVVSFPCDPFGWNSELPFASNRSVKKLTFPELLSGKIECAQKSARPRYRHDKSKSMRCEEPKTGKHENLRAGPLCGSSNEADGTYAKVLNCPENLKHLCSLNQHTKVHRHPDFNDYLASRGIVQGFIKARLSDWRPSSSAAVSGTPCDFVDYNFYCGPKAALK